jgi:hypothetical protein
MKTRVLTLFLTLQIFGQCLAKTVRLPDVPEPSISVEQVLAISQKVLGKNAEAVMLVGMDWCLFSQFRPRYITGATYIDLQKDSEEYYWFVTYIDRKTDPQSPPEREKFREVTVIQVGKDGKGRVLPWLRK